MTWDAKSQLPAGERLLRKRKRRSLVSEHTARDISALH